MRNLLLGNTICVENPLYLKINYCKISDCLIEHVSKNLHSHNTEQINRDICRELLVELKVVR
jgi:hypothetical protein